MKKINTKHVGWLILSMMLFFSCQKNESRTKIDNERTSSKKMGKTEYQDIDIRDNFILYNLNVQNGDQELHFFAIKTYCKSWDLPLVKMKAPKSDTYPIMHQNDTLAIFEQSWVPDDWKNGIVLLKPDTLPLFISFTNDSQLNQISKVDDFFRFNIIDKKRKNKKMTTQDYENQYKNLLIDVDNYYDFPKRLEVMDSQFINYSKTTNMTNDQFIASFFSLKYHISEKNYALIAHCLIQYPLEFIYDGKKELIKSPEEILNRWDTIFSRPTLQSLGNSVYWRLNTEEKAIYTDQGAIWFKHSGNRVKIIKISTP